MRGRRLLLLLALALVTTKGTATTRTDDGRARRLAAALGVEDADALERTIAGQPLDMLEQLGHVSDLEPPRIARTFRSPAHARAADVIAGWMRAAGLLVSVDALANVRGITPPDRVQADGRAKPRIIVGSHYDTVIDAGKYDGTLGIVAGIQAVRALLLAPKPIPRFIEVVAFSDEEGVRFPVTFLGSRAMAGTLTDEHLNVEDNDGVTLLEALKPHSHADVRLAALRSSDVSTYVEAHVEQGPVLERLNQPLAVVLGIAGQKRLSLSLRGKQGHAGTTPMGEGRHDALATAAAIVGAVESICAPGWRDRGGALGGAATETSQAEEMLVCTIGQLVVSPNAKNVIAGAVNATGDVRARRVAVRDAAIQDIAERARMECEKRKLAGGGARMSHEADPQSCAEGPTERLRGAVGKFLDYRDASAVPALVSGAGHDALAMATVADIAMLFVRNPGGDSHTPSEVVWDKDIVAATGAMAMFLWDEMHGEECIAEKDANSM